MVRLDGERGAEEAEAVAKLRAAEIAEVEQLRAEERRVETEGSGSSLGFIIVSAHVSVGPPHQHHWTNLQTGVKQSLVEAIENARKLDERVAREIEISIRSGVFMNSRNESYDRRARNTARQSATIRKAHESHQLSDEVAEIDHEIEEIRVDKRESAARLKALQARRIHIGASAGKFSSTTTCHFDFNYSSPIFSMYSNSTNLFSDPNSTSDFVPGPSFTGYNLPPPDVSNFSDGAGFDFDFDNFDLSFLDNFAFIPTADGSMASSSFQRDGTNLGAGNSELLPQFSTAPPSPRLPPIPVSSPPISPTAAPVPEPMQKQHRRP
ncbi:hypothetical protein B0H13DRAFT_2557648 [Mycena leptocephala]|nr:hypothetical protein B0H13DRAFT_2557648 [Mycena leptocephala]